MSSVSKKPRGIEWVLHIFSFLYILFSVYTKLCIYSNVLYKTYARYLHYLKVSRIFAIPVTHFSFCTLLAVLAYLRMVSEKILRPRHRSHTQNALKNAFFNIQIFVYLKTHIFRNLIIQIQHTYRTIIKKINHTSRHITTGLPIRFPMETLYSIRNASKNFLSAVSD